MTTNDLPKHLKDAPAHVIARYVACQVATNGITDPKEKAQVWRETEDEIRRQREEGTL